MNRFVWALAIILDEDTLVAQKGDRGTIVVDPSPACPYPTVQFEKSGRSTMVDPEEITSEPTFKHPFNVVDGFLA